MFDPTSKSSNPSAEFVCLLTEHQSELWAYIIAQLPGSPDVADVLQKTNLALWTKQEQFTPGTNFKAWAFKVARFEVLAHLKKNKRNSWLVFRDELSDVMAEEGTQVFSSARERMTHLDVCMQQLKPEHQQLIRHRYQANSSLEQYSSQSGRSVSSLSVTLHRLREVLRRCISERLHEERGQA